MSRKPALGTEKKRADTWVYNFRHCNFDKTLKKEIGVQVSTSLTADFFERETTPTKRFSTATKRHWTRTVRGKNANGKNAREGAKPKGKLPQ